MQNTKERKINWTKDNNSQGYTLRDRTTGKILKFGETTMGKKRYTQKFMDENDARMYWEAAGTKRQMHTWNHEQILNHKATHGGIQPPLNKSDWQYCGAYTMDKKTVTLRFWISSETQSDVGNLYVNAEKIIEKAVKKCIKNKNYGLGLNLWAYIAVIPNEETTPYYPEVKRYRKRKKEVEFRLKINHKEFLEGDSNTHIRLLAQSVLRSVELMKHLHIKDFDLDSLAADVNRCLSEYLWHKYIDFIASHKYYYQGRRTEKTVYGSPDVTTKYCYNGDQVITEYDGSNTLLRKFIYGPGIDESITMIVPGTPDEWYFYFYVERWHPAQK